MRTFWNKITNWELWPFKVIYAPLGFAWLYYAIKARAFWFFSNVNPTLEFSGFEGETKREMYEQLPLNIIPETIYIKARQPFEKVEQLYTSSQLAFPIIAKPEIGMQGILVRKIRSIAELKAYHEHIPVDYVLQSFIDLPMEFSIFHIRYPEQNEGILTGFILKEYLQVKGDGQSTLLELIRRHPKAMYREEEMRHLHEGKLEMVLEKGVSYSLSFTGNHNRGAKFINLHKEIDDRLRKVFDAISLKAGNFHYGRYDLKCTSIEDLKDGKNIVVLEYNGAGAEPNHIYDCGMSYFNALKEVNMHWRHLYKIGRINYKKGVKYWSFRAGKNQLDKSARYFKELHKYDQLF